GLSEIDAIATDPRTAYEVLWPYATHLAMASEVRPADPATTASVLARLQILPDPPGLSDEERRRLADLRARAAALREVFVVVAEAGELPVALAATTGALVFLLR